MLKTNLYIKIELLVFIIPLILFTRIFFFKLEHSIHYHDFIIQIQFSYTILNQLLLKSHLNPPLNEFFTILFWLFLAQYF
jgi:hypothetical protein